MFDTARTFFQIFTLDISPWKLSNYSCCKSSSTLPIFVPQTKDGPYLNLNHATSTTTRTSQQKQERYERRLNRSPTRPCIVSIKLANWEIQCFKVGCTLSSLLIHAKFDDVTRLCGYNKFEGLRVDWGLENLRPSAQPRSSREGMSKQTGDGCIKQVLQEIQVEL